MLEPDQKKLIGAQGEQARFIPYRLEESLTPEDILRELRRQPRMAQLVRKLDADRRVYLLEGPDAEQLFLAAEYIGTWHRLKNSLDGRYDRVEDAEGDPEDRWHDVDTREFDFDRNLPFLAANEVREFHCPDEGFGFGNNLYRPELTPKNRPWWTMSPDAPIVLSLTAPDNAFRPADTLSGLPRLVENMRDRALIIVLFQCRNQERETESVYFSHGATMENVSFELETDYIRLGAPDQESRYKQEILRQLAREKGMPLAPKASAEKILSLIKEHRGNVSNRTIAKAVSNALLRRKTRGLLNGSSTICVNAAELKAKYVGHTTGKVKALFTTPSSWTRPTAWRKGRGMTASPGRPWSSSAWSWRTTRRTGWSSSRATAAPGTRETTGCSAFSRATRASTAGCPLRSGSRTSRSGT